MSSRQPLQFYNALERFLEIPQIASHLTNLQHFDWKYPNQHQFIPYSYIPPLNALNYQNQVFHPNSMTNHTNLYSTDHKKYTANNFKQNQRDQLLQFNLFPFGNLPTTEKKLQFTFQAGEKPLKYLILIDLECTCDSQTQIQTQEIIEFPILILDTSTLQIVDTFHSYVRPTINPILTDFCTQLTGISQQTVDKSNPLEYVLRSIDHFLDPYKYKSICMLNDCPSDINFLQKECKTKQIHLKSYFTKFIDLKRAFPIEHVNSLDQMLKSLQLEFVGRKHKGIDDVKNIARVVAELGRRGYVYGNKLCQEYAETKAMASLSIKWGKGLNKGIQEISIVGLQQSQNGAEILWDMINDQEMKEKDRKTRLMSALYILDNFVNNLSKKFDQFHFVVEENSLIIRLREECEKYQIKVPDYFIKFLNIRKHMKRNKLVIEQKQTKTNLDISLNIAQMTLKTLEHIKYMHLEKI